MKKRPLFYDMVRDKDASPFLRTGQSGEGNQVLSKEQIERFNKKCKEYFVGDLESFDWQLGKEKAVLQAEKKAKNQ